jgi:hypothetical protein
MPFREAHLRRWQVTAAFLLFVVGVMVAINIAISQGKHADIVTCRQSTEGRRVLRDTLNEQADFFEPLVAVSADMANGKRYIALLRHRAHELEEPPPCAKELGLD